MLTYINALGQLIPVDGHLPDDIPELEYPAVLRDVVRRKSRAGNDMIVLRWALQHPGGNDTVRIIEEYNMIKQGKFTPLRILYKLAGQVMPDVADLTALVKSASKLKGTRAMVQYKERGFSYVSGAC